MVTGVVATIPPAKLGGCPLTGWMLLGRVCPCLGSLDVVPWGLLPGTGGTGPLHSVGDQEAAALTPTPPWLLEPSLLW